MNFFASEDTKKIKLKSGIELEVRQDISKRTFNKLIATIPQVTEDKGLTAAQATDFSASLFSAFVVGWNLDRDATVDSYLELKRQHADEIDEAISTHFSAMSVTEKESRKS